MANKRRTKARAANYARACALITDMWRHCVKTHGYVSDTHRAIQRVIDSLDVTAKDRQKLNIRHWSIRQFVIASHHHWQLYLDGARVTSEEITKQADIAIAAAAAAALAGETAVDILDVRASIWRRVAGRAEWADAPGHAFYTCEEPYSSGGGGGA